MRRLVSLLVALDIHRLVHSSNAWVGRGQQDSNSNLLHVPMCTSWTLLCAGCLGGMLQPRIWRITGIQGKPVRCSTAGNVMCGLGAWAWACICVRMMPDLLCKIGVHAGCSPVTGAARDRGVPLIACSLARTLSQTGWPPLARRQQGEALPAHSHLSCTQSGEASSHAWSFDQDVFSKGVQLEFRPGQLAPVLFSYTSQNQHLRLEDREHALFTLALQHFCSDH